MKRRIANFLFAAMASVLFAGSLAMPANAKGEELTGKTSMEITQMMGKGWNLGNSLDAHSGNKKDIYSQEQSWGNPVITKELIDGVKAAGFNTIRIPITWYKYIDKNDGYKIDDEFLAHVTEVVNYAYDNDLFVIINVHHEEWVNDINIDKNYVQIGEELEAVWKQLADNFADYDQHLIFEGMNEPRAQGADYEWVGNTACYEAVNYLDQIFVTTIRENGKGYNSERALMVPGYAASNNPSVLKSIVLPKIDGNTAKNIIVSVHCYSPYNFCLSDNQTTFDAGNTKDTSDITTMMSNLNSLFIKKDIPVVIGECGATNSGDNTEAREAWFTYFGEITSKYGIPAILWDNGSKGNSGGECHNYFYRKTGEVYSESLINCFIYGDVDGNLVKDLMIDFEPYKVGSGISLATPEQFGFEPKTMGKKSKINHTENAAVGYAAVVTVDNEKSYAEMDLSKYAGKSVNFKMYVMSKSSDSVTVGIKDAESKDMVTTDINSDWTEIIFSYTFANNTSEKKLYFKGAGADEFYIDDISVTQVSEKEMVSASAGNSENASAQASQPDTQGAQNAAENITNNDIVAADDANGSSINIANIAIAVAVAGLVLIILAVVISSAQSKKKED